MRIARRYVIRGVVQGVGFRYFVYRKASEHGIAGWVQNRSDGCVEVHAEGGPEGLLALERDLRAGPRTAHVNGVDVHEDRATESSRGFHIR